MAVGSEDQNNGRPRCAARQAPRNGIRRSQAKEAHEESQ
ncbi:hypothetical protein C7S16_0438 [Burkholderia thailandensis]|uniref:Uncharacterized protein n=1 Tax=Burkholderia thailandensis TaxID=57975 RepID=A0AAW9D526_BURTH|nr:hypothetical protein [Burkholderia thailandensis]